MSIKCHSEPLPGITRSMGTCRYPMKTSLWLKPKIKSLNWWQRGTFRLQTLLSDGAVARGIDPGIFARSVQSRELVGAAVEAMP